MNPLQMIQKSLATIAKQMPAAETQMEPDTRSMLLNVLSMLQEVLGIGQATPPEEAMVVEEEIANTSQEDDMVGKEKKVEKPIGDEGVNTRLEDQTPITNNALSEIGKSLGELTSILAGNQVRKSRTVQAAPNNALMQTLTAMTQVMKGLTDKVNQNQQFMGKFMETIGISDDIVKKAMEPPAVNTIPEKRPVQSAEMMAFMTEWMKSMNGNNTNNSGGQWPVNKQNDPWSQNGDVRKSFDPLLDHLLTK